MKGCHPMGLHNENAGLRRLLAEYNAEIEMLRLALLSSHCPRPYGDTADDNTVGDCIRAGVCGCDNATALSETGANT